MALKWAACIPVHTHRGKLYSTGGAQSPGVKGLERSLRTFEPGDFITAADVGGSAAFEELAAADAIAPVGTADYRIAREAALARANAELSFD